MLRKKKFHRVFWVFGLTVEISVGPYFFLYDTNHEHDVVFLWTHPFLSGIKEICGDAPLSPYSKWKMNKISRIQNGKWKRSPHWRSVKNWIPQRRKGVVKCKMKKISPLSKCKKLNPSEKEANNRSVKFKSLREGNRRSEKDPLAYGRRQVKKWKRSPLGI